MRYDCRVNNLSCQVSRSIKDSCSGPATRDEFSRRPQISMLTKCYCTFYKKISDDVKQLQDSKLNLHIEAEFGSAARKVVELANASQLL